MQFDVEARTATLSVGEFSAFSVGPREAGDGAQGVWRAQLGTHWHGRMREQLVAQRADATFEVAITGQVAHRGWILTLAGRIDQLLPAPGPSASSHPLGDLAAKRSGPPTLREIKTITDPLPAAEEDLRAAYPEYFVQLATYLALHRFAPGPGLGQPIAEQGAGPARGELVFVEVASGLSQSVALSPADEVLFRAQLEAVLEFLELRRRARDRLRALQFRPAFASPRPGQETTRADLDATLTTRHGAILFEAPTGFGKTGVLLESALGQLKSGHFERVLYLTSKSTGQLQVVRTLDTMCSGPAEGGKLKVQTRSPGSGDPASGLSTFNPQLSPAATRSVAAWHVRNKAEHCVNHTFECVRERCAYLNGIAARWPESGLSRFWRDEREARDLDTLRTAGRNALICPYEITRAALAFNDVWIGDYNYVFAPGNRGLFYNQPGFQPAQTLLLIDEAHNLPSRVADALSHEFSAMAAQGVASELHRIRPPEGLTRAWDRWTRFLGTLRRSDALTLSDEDEARHLLREIADAVSQIPLDYAALAPGVSEVLWSVKAAADRLEESDLPRLWWSPDPGVLLVTCLDAAPYIGATLSEFGGVVLASATFGPVESFAAACGLDRFRPPAAAAPVTPPAEGRLGELNKRRTKKLYAQLTSAAALLKVEEAAAAAAPAMVRAATPWRDGAYDIAYDARVDTTFQQRAAHYPVTAETIALLRQAAAGSVAVFFSSYAYAQAVADASALRVALQPRGKGLSEQSEWVEASLNTADALFLVLGSSFAESVDLLGGRVTHALVAGPALPEVNAVQRARMAELTGGGRTSPPLGREEAFRRVYQIPGMTKVNQALGRLVRAPGQHAKVILHCRRFTEASYAELLAADYRNGTVIASDRALAEWLAR